MALDISALNEQIRVLKQQSAAASHCAQMLALYKKELIRSWSGREIPYFCKTIDAQIQKCRQLSASMEQVSYDIMQAAEEILREEATLSQQEA